MGEGEENTGKLIVEAAEGDRESKPPRSSLPSTLKSTGVLIASLAALATSLGAIFKPQDHSVTQESYTELSKGITSLTEQSQKNHDDIVALRTYMSTKNGDTIVLPSQIIEPVVIPSGGGGGGSPAPSTSATAALRPLIRDAGAVVVVTAANTAKPPEVHDFRSYDPPSFDRVLMNAKK